MVYTNQSIEHYNKMKAELLAEAQGLKNRTKWDYKSSENVIDGLHEFMVVNRMWCTIISFIPADKMINYTQISTRHIHTFEKMLFEIVD